MKKCEHKNVKNLTSFNIPHNNSNVIEVICLDCKQHRYETRYPNGRIDTSNWFNPRTCRFN